MKVEAKFYEKLNGNRIHCCLCPHNCIINENNFGKCKVRTNENGKLFTINYGEITSIALDPIEKNLYTILSPQLIYCPQEVSDVILPAVSARTTVFHSSGQGVSFFHQNS